MLDTRHTATSGIHHLPMLHERNLPPPNREPVAAVFPGLYVSAGVTF